MAKNAMLNFLDLQLSHMVKFVYGRHQNNAGAFG